MPAEWPESLYGCILKSGFKETPPENTIRTDMGYGPAKVRRRTTANIRKFSISMFFSSTQLTTFETFYTTTISSGSVSFNFRHPRTQAVESFRIANIPTYDPMGMGYIVVFQMEMMP